MANRFLISDTHFGHTKMCDFKRDDGSPLRPWATVSEMDEALIENWNKVVKPGDKVYHLGDVAIPRSGLKCLSRLNGSKILIRGNHDIFKIRDYLQYFKDIRGTAVIERYALSHVPVHEKCIERWKANIHGHLHYKRMLNDDGSIDKRYLSVCVETIDYRPIEWSEALQRHEAA